MNEKTIDIERIEKESKELCDKVEQSVNKAFKRLSQIAHEVAKTYAEHKDEIDAEVERSRLEQERLQATMPKILIGDIIREKSIHCSELYCYQVDSIERGDYISHTAHHAHHRNEIIAIYRFDGMDFKCIWEREDYKEYKRKQS